MLQEIEMQPFRHHVELSKKIKTDTVIVGSGVMGLLLAKKLVDLGQTVVLLDENPKLSYGASVKNHGWLHSGTVHAVSIPDRDQAKKVVRKLMYGHEYIKSYAGESIEDPFDAVYITTGNDDLAEKAIEIWDETGVYYEEISKKNFLREDPYLNPDLSLHIFKSADLRLNNRIFFQKLLTDIKSKNGTIITDAHYLHTDEHEVYVQSRGNNISVNADLFIYCVGAKTKEIYKKLTNEEIEIALWKSHLLFLPQIAPYSLVSLDRGQPIIINHQGTSVINRGYDEVLCKELDYSTDPSEVLQTFESLCSVYPTYREMRGELKYIACIKPSLLMPKASRHSVDSQILEPLPGHFFVLPGKMTEAPYVADEVIRRLYQSFDFDEISLRPLDIFNNETSLEKNQSKNFHMQQAL